MTIHVLQWWIKLVHDNVGSSRRSVAIRQKQTCCKHTLYSSPVNQPRDNCPMKRQGLPGYPVHNLSSSQQTEVQVQFQCIIIKPQMWDRGSVKAILMYNGLLRRRMQLRHLRSYVVVDQNQESSLLDFLLFCITRNLWKQMRRTNR